MGYHIDYANGGARVWDAPKKAGHGRVIVFALLLVAIFLFQALLPEAVDTLREHLIPGDRAVTSAAFSQMLASLRDGAPCTQAFTAFCREIIDGAEIPI